MLDRIFRFIKRHQQKFSLLLLVLLSVFQWKAGIIPGWKMQSDFPNYYVSAKLVADGHRLDSIYDDAWFNLQLKEYRFEQQGKFSPFPPPTVFVMMPLTPFDPLTAKRIWMIINLVLLFVT